MPEHKLEKPHIRLALIRDLATGAGTQTELAAKYGVDQSAVSRFQQRHQLRIEEVRRNADDEYAGIAFAQKRNRIEQHVEFVEYCTNLLGDPEKQAKVNVGTAEIIRAAQSSLHSISEELGQLPARGLKHEDGQ